MGEVPQDKRKANATLILKREKKIQELKFSQDPREGERESNSGNTFVLRTRR